MSAPGLTPKTLRKWKNVDPFQRDRFERAFHLPTIIFCCRGYVSFHGKSDQMGHHKVSTNLEVHFGLANQPLLWIIWHWKETRHHLFQSILSFLFLYTNTSKTLREAQHIPWQRRKTTSVARFFFKAKKRRTDDSRLNQEMPKRVTEHTTTKCCGMVQIVVTIDVWNIYI